MSPVSTRLLVHAMVREDGTVDTGELYAVAGTLDMSDQQVRLCIKRLVAEGRFTHEGRGRKALLHATADVTGSIAPDVGYVRHAYRQDRGLAPWDGAWHLFAFAIPESNRSARDSLRDALLDLGAAAIQGGLYVSANAIGEYVAAQARQLGVGADVTFLTSGDLRIGEQADAAGLAAALWPLEEIAARYEHLAAVAETHLCNLAEPGRPSGTEQLAVAIDLASAFSQAMRPDPLLPPELLPQPWPGTSARHLAAKCWRTLLEQPPGSTPQLRLFRLYAGIIDE